MKERTDEEILSWVKELTAVGDYFGYQRSDLISFLPFERAKPFLKDGIVYSQWHSRSRDSGTILSEITSYMSFAWGQANECRGLSAARSLDHMKAWLWMLGEEKAAAALEEYTFYGKPQLRAICEKFDLPWKSWDNKIWKAEENDPPGDPLPAASLPWKEEV